MPRAPTTRTRPTGWMT
uniref:Uncharacterized protein n=1 Tax=Macrostomum lignano TaxID=282301 RepID=A0A1I8G468_9PLAT